MSNLFGLTPEQFLGKPTLHLPLNMIAYAVGDGDKVTGVFQTDMGRELLFGSDKTHVLILGDVFVRPRLVFGSNEFRGHGINGLAREGFVEHDKWINDLIFERK